MTLWGDGKIDSNGKKKIKKAFPFKTNKGRPAEESDSMESEFMLGNTVDNQDDIYDNDLRNAEIVFDSHDSNPLNVLRLQKYDDSPMAKGDEEVVIKVEVRPDGRKYIIT